MTGTLKGGRLVPIPDALPFVDWLLGTGPAPALPAVEAALPAVEAAPAADFRWALLQCTDTLVWAVRERNAGSGRAGWRLATERADPPEMRNGSRKPTRETLREARLFGPQGETLLWHTGDADGAPAFAGRFLTEETTPEPDHTPLKRGCWFEPTAEEASDRERRAGKTDDPKFVRRTTLGGRTTVTPRGEGVLLHEYVAEDETGTLRVAATRFVCVAKSLKKLLKEEEG